MISWACSDLHGHLKAYDKIKKFINPDDVVFCLGDCGDRGPDPWETIKTVAKDEQFIYLKGNHEDMLVKAAREVFNFEFNPYCEKQRILASNGGMETLDQLLGEEKPEQWVNYLNKLPTHITYINKKEQEIFLSHAGCTFWKDDEFTLPSEKDMLWDRLHFYDNAKLLGKPIVVHGHTSKWRIASELGILVPTGALEYADGKKYCIDAATYRKGRIILLNLDSLESFEFSIND